MRIMKTTLLVCALALVAGTANAAKGDMWAGVQGGLAVPTSDLGDMVDMGWDGSIMGSYGVAKDCAVGIELGYHQFKGKDDVNGVDLSELTVSALQATVFTTYRFPVANEKQMPYAKLGLGIYNLKAKVDLPAPDDFDESKSKFGFNIGLGYDYAVSPGYTIGLIGQYHMIMLDDEDITNIDGDKFNPSLFTIGAKLAFGVTK